MKLLKRFNTIPLLLCCLVLTSCGKPTLEKVQSSLSNGNYPNATSDFAKLTEEDKISAIENFKTETDNIKTKYLNNDVDLVEATKSLTELKAINEINETTESTLRLINNVCSSRTSYETAIDAEKKEDFSLALQEYSKVIQDDVLNYATSQSKIKEITTNLESNTKVVLEDIKLIDTADYDSSPPLLTAIFRNKSDKTIKQIRIGFLAYDQNGSPVIIKSNYSNGEEPGFLYVAFSKNENISPGSTSGEKIGWGLVKDHGITTLKATVINVEFYDGTSWENPLYNSWIDKYKGKPLT